MSEIFTLPDLGEGLQEAEIVAWHVAEGDHVVADQPLVSVETEKAVVEIPSPRAGRIARLMGAVGDIVKTGAPLVAFAEGPAADTGAVVGELPGAEARREPAEKKTAGARVKAAPAVRALARRLGVDLAAVVPSGPQGRVTRADVERAAGAAAAEEAGAPEEPLRGPRRAMARNMARARAEVAHATLTDEADIEAWPAGLPRRAIPARRGRPACPPRPAALAQLRPPGGHRRRGRPLPRRGPRRSGTTGIGGSRRESAAMNRLRDKGG